MYNDNCYKKSFWIYLIFLIFMKMKLFKTVTNETNNNNIITEEDALINYKIWIARLENKLNEWTYNSELYDIYTFVLKSQIKN